MRRFLRFTFRAALLGGAGFAAAKIAQSLRTSSRRGMPSGDTSSLPRRSETPLVEPNMLHGVALKTGEDDGGAAIGNVITETPPAAPAAEPVAAPAAETAEPATGAAWASPDNGACPPGYPVKAKLASGIFHEPGGANYARTQADRCYLSADAAEADGLRRSKR